MVPNNRRGYAVCGASAFHRNSSALACQRLFLFAPRIAATFRARQALPRTLLLCVINLVAHTARRQTACMQPSRQGLCRWDCADPVAARHL